MEPPLVLPRGGRVPWQDLLLAVSLLTLWNPPTTAQVTVESVPPSATEGKDVLLQIHNLPRDTGRFNWYKGATTEENHRIVSYVVDTQKTILGPAHSGRETVYPKGSLLFRNITLKDTGVYILQIINRTYDTAEITGQVRVFKPLAQPALHASNTTVTEDKDSVALTCSTNNPGVSIGWLFNGQSLKLMERMTLTQDNSTLTIRPVRKEDAGNYQCEVSNPGDSRKSDPVMLAVSWPVAGVTSESSAAQHPPPGRFQPAATNRRTPCPAPQQPFLSTRNYDTQTQTHTARSTTKQKCLLSFPRAWEPLRPRTLGGVRSHSLCQRTSTRP
ncbi:carcinoembryonic antigen-related cell adhesion molecule 21-like isoform X4 [Mustela lutreola]|uniref:carcinoembryonic antigen-related cell adhesion molecule 21-like isoform X4 n=1 Tax=Mustela lutreola TaxID=9666 RepID=UPI00279767E2|nr:carcinoembryonic antigen-related cell adhesion molecule 21-like isoform X4 [Mustela lutreola]